jgi:hypothetical protein
MNQEKIKVFKEMLELTIQQCNTLLKDGESEDLDFGSIIDCTIDLCREFE